MRLRGFFFAPALRWLELLSAARLRADRVEVFNAAALDEGRRVKPQKNMMIKRRVCLTAGARVAALLLGGGALAELACAQAPTPGAGRAAFDAKTMNEALKALGYAAPVESRDVSIQAPDIAEDGASVAVSAACSLAGVKQVMFLLDGAPTALAAVFNLGAELEAEASTRLRLARSSVVFAVAITQDKKVLFAQKEVKVAMGACGADAKPARGLRADGVSGAPVRC